MTVRAQANVIGRIATLAGVLDVDLSSISAALGERSADLARHALVTVPHTFDRIAVTTRVAREALLAGGGAQVQRFGELLATAHDVDVEYETRPGGGSLTTLRAVGSRELAAACEGLARLGIDAEMIASARGCALQLGADRLVAVEDRDDDVWRLYIAQPNRDDTERAATRRRIATVASLLGVTGPQRRVVESLHDVLAKDNESYTSLTIDRGTGIPRLALRWIDVRWETIIRMMMGFYPALDAGTRLGEFAGAFDAELAAAVELALGPGEPPDMRVSISVA